MPAHNPRAIAINHPNYTAILAALAPYEKLHTSQVQAQLPHRSQQNIIRRLADLHNHGYIGRTLLEHRNYLEENAHWILPKGREQLASRGVFPATIMRKSVGEARRDDPHKLMTNNYLASVKNGAKDRFVPLPEKRIKLPYKISHTFKSGAFKKHEGTLRPDALMGIRHGELINYYIIESEHTSPVEPEIDALDRSSFLRKALGYGDILFGSKVFKELLGIRKIRVVTTAPTLERMEHKRDLVERLYGLTDTFIFQVVPLNGNLAPMFTVPYYLTGGRLYSMDTGAIINTD